VKINTLKIEFDNRNCTDAFAGFEKCKPPFLTLLVLQYRTRLFYCYFPAVFGSQRTQSRLRTRRSLAH